jgi:pyruvate,water dikinase
MPKVGAAGNRILLRGVGASGGIACGPARIVRGSAEAHRVHRGDILVAELTSSTHTVAIHKAGAIVTDRGGIMCHAAIDAREIGIPCVVGTKKATKILKEGIPIIVDGTRGIVCSATQGSN